MFRFYTTVILGCCLFMAQPTITYAARSTQHSASRATRAKNKKMRVFYIAVGTAALIAVGIGAGVWVYRTSKKDKMVTPPTTDDTGAARSLASGLAQPEPAQIQEQPTTSHATGVASDLQAPDSAHTATAQPEPAPRSQPVQLTPRRATQPASFVRGAETPETTPFDRSSNILRTPASTSHWPPLPDSPTSELNEGFLRSTPPSSGAGSDVSPARKAQYIRNCDLFYKMFFGPQYDNKSDGELISARKPFWDFIKSFQVAPGFTEEQVIEQMREQYIPLAEQQGKRMQNLFAHTATSPGRPLLPRAGQMPGRRLAFGSAAGGGTVGASGK